MFKPDRKLLRKYCKYISETEARHKDLVVAVESFADRKWMDDTDKLYSVMSTMRTYVARYGSDELYYHSDKLRYVDILAKRILKRII